nr:immunoglobulin heavy chain junction region [Mus musculus]
HISVQDLGTL